MTDAERGAMIALSVSDSGTGMDEDTLARVFEPFFTTKMPGKGTGLGLSQVYGFASQSGGDVRIDSTPERGTTVTLLLPRRGFGNLIALPLEGRCRQNRTTLFVDPATFEPYQDQFAYLSSQLPVCP